MLKKSEAKNEDPDKTAHLGAGWSGSRLFACMLKLVFDVIN